MTGYYQTTLLCLHATIAIVQRQFQRLRETRCKQNVQKTLPIYRHLTVEKVTNRNRESQWTDDLRWAERLSALKHVCASKHTDSATTQGTC